jgi:beta-glucosidase
MPIEHLRLNHFDEATVQRAEALLAQMTLEEKIGQMTQATRMDGLDGFVRGGRVGSILSIPELAELNRLQRIAVEETRLHIPLINGFDVIHGQRTVFPIPLAEACTWNPELLAESSRIAAIEATCFGIHWIFAPMVDICRDPRWGRIAEGAGEDPYLGSAVARAHVRGFQAVDLPDGRRIVACPKHYVAYGAAEAGKDYNTTDMSERTLRDVYLPPFHAAFDEGAGTTMSAFNDLNGVPTSANPFTLKTVLRDEWGWDGLVVSDYNSIGELVPHGIAADLKEAAQKASTAGVEMDMMSGAFPYHLADLVEAGQVPLAAIDSAVRHVLCLKIALGLFENPYTDETLADRYVLLPEYRAKALEVATESMVLLKNEGELLPLAADSGKVAVIGPLANDHQSPLGCWAWMGRAEDVESVLDGIEAVWQGAAPVAYAEGCALNSEELEADKVAAAVAAAEAADVAVVVLGEADAMSGEAHSRAYIDFPGRQQDLLEAVVATGTPVVLVVVSGRPLELTWASENVAAILQAWQGGIRTGRAVADLLFGAASPSGRLSVSFPRTVGQIPVYYAHKNTGRPAAGEGTRQFQDPFRSVYIDEVNAPLYPFGYGLGYTTFSYRGLRVEKPALGLGDTLAVTATVANSGARAGVETVQLYVRDLVGSVTRPVRQLKGFQKVSLAAGESREVRFEVPVSELGFHGVDNAYVVEPGAFKVWVGGSSNADLEGDFSVIA